MTIRRLWTTADVSFALHDDATDDPVVTVEIWTPDGVLYILAEVEIAGASLLLKGAHFSGLKPNDLSVSRLRQIARLALEHGGWNEVVIEGAVRTTGAGPGHRPQPVRFRC